MYTLNLNLGVSQDLWSQFYTEVKQGSRDELACIHPKGFNSPVYIRRSTHDIDNFVQIFLSDEYGFVTHNPSTILDLGGYVGFASAYLAHKYPNSSILLVEPDPDNYTISRLNCRQFPNVECLNVGVWSKSCYLTVADRSRGDSGIMFREIADNESVESKVKAMSIGDLMEYKGFDVLDMLKMDIEGAERQIFSDPKCKNWIRKSNLISCELHDSMVSGCSSAYHEAMRWEGFTHGRHGEYDYYIRPD